MIPYARPAPEIDRSSAHGSRSAVAQMRERVLQWSPELSPDSATLKAATLLLASRAFGQNVDRLALIAELPRDFVARCARRLVDNGVWAEGKLVSAWQDAEGDSLAFWADVGVAEGKLCRRASAEGRLEWAPAGHWRKSYDYLRRADHPDGSIRYHEVRQQPASETTVSLPESRPTPPPVPVAAKEPATASVRHLGSSDHFADTVWLT